MLGLMSGSPTSCHCMPRGQQAPGEPRVPAQMADTGKSQRGLSFTGALGQRPKQTELPGSPQCLGVLIPPDAHFPCSRRPHVGKALLISLWLQSSVGQGTGRTPWPAGSHKHQDPRGSRTVPLVPTALLLMATGRLNPGWLNPGSACRTRHGRWVAQDALRINPWHLEIATLSVPLREEKRAAESLIWS